MANELLLYLRIFRYCKQKFLTDKPLSGIKYYPLYSQNKTLFYPFNNYLVYVLVNNFTEFEIEKSNVDRILYNRLMTLLTEKLFY